MVQFNAGDPHRQPEGFRCCPLGAQFFSDVELTPYNTVSFRLDDPASGPGAVIECQGVVVNCVPVADSAEYKIFVYFVDLNAEHQARLSALAKTSGLICPYCENFS